LSFDLLIGPCVKEIHRGTWEFLQEEDYSEDLGIHGKIILTCSLKK